MNVGYAENVSDSCLVVVIPTFRAGRLLADAILSVRKAEIPSSLTVKIIIVDNSEDSSDRFYSADANVYHPMPNNPGFGTAVNKGIEIAFQKYAFEWVLLLNPDAKLSEDFFIILSQKGLDSSLKSINPVMPLICFDKPIHRVKASYLKENGIENISFLDPFDQFLLFTEEGRPLDFLDHRQKTLTKGNTLCIRVGEGISNQLIYSNISSSEAGLNSIYESLEFDAESLILDFLVQNAGSEIHSPYSAGDLLTGYLASSVKSHFGGPRRAWCGAGVLLPRSYIETFGRFDSSFFLYYEDTEFSYRAISSGFLPTLMPALQIFHKHSAITSQNVSLRAKSIWQSRALFVVRTSGLGNATLLSLGILARAAILLIRKQTSVKHLIRFLLPEFFHTLVGIAKGISIRSGS
jgi:GT2 family glycosyltransferase